MILELQIFIEIVEKTKNSKIYITIRLNRHLIIDQLVSPIQDYKESKKSTSSVLKENDYTNLYY